MLKAFNVARKYLNNVEFLTYKTAYEPNYKLVEVRADELLEKFEKIDKISKRVDRNWNIQCLTMNQVLS